MENQKINRQIYIDKELSDKIQEFANEEGLSFNKAIQILLQNVDFDNAKGNWI